MTETKVTVCVDEECAGEAWWSAAREAVTADAVPDVGSPGEHPDVAEVVERLEAAWGGETRIAERE